jgi:hypothetical protein
MEEGKYIYRGLLNTNIGNRKYTQAMLGSREVINKKYSAPNHEIEREKILNEIMPRDHVQQKLLSSFIDDQLEQNPEDASYQAAWHMYKRQVETELFKNKQNKEFMLGFQKWLVGKGKDEDHQKTPWGKKFIRDKGVLAYLDAFLDKKLSFYEEITRLAVRGYGQGPPLKGINDFYLFYKYIIKGQFGKDGAGDFMYDWKHLMGPNNIYEQGDVKPSGIDKINIKNPDLMALFGEQEAEKEESDVKIEIDEIEQLKLDSGDVQKAAEIKAEIEAAEIEAAEIDAKIEAADKEAAEIDAKIEAAKKEAAEIEATKNEAAEIKAEIEAADKEAAEIDAAAQKDTEAAEKKDTIKAIEAHRVAQHSMAAAKTKAKAAQLAHDEFEQKIIVKGTQITGPEEQQLSELEQKAKDTFQEASEAIIAEEKASKEKKAAFTAEKAEKKAATTVDVTQVPEKDQDDTTEAEEKTSKEKKAAFTAEKAEKKAATTVDVTQVPEKDQDDTTEAVEVTHLSGYILALQEKKQAMKDFEDARIASGTATVAAGWARYRLDQAIQNTEEETTIRQLEGELKDQETTATTAKQAKEKAQLQLEESTSKDQTFVLTEIKKIDDQKFKKSISETYEKYRDIGDRHDKLQHVITRDEVEQLLKTARDTGVRQASEISELTTTLLLDINTTMKHIKSHQQKITTKSNKMTDKQKNIWLVIYNNQIDTLQRIKEYYPALDATPSQNRVDRKVGALQRPIK